MICMAAAGRKKGLSERIGKIFAEIINIFTGSFWTECPEVDNGLKNRLGLNWNPSFQFASLSSDLANRLHK